MLNKIWPFFIIISFIYALLNLKIPELNESIFNSCSQTVEMILSFLGIMCMWNGIMQIIKETTLINKIKRILRPFMKFLFPKLNTKSKAYEEMTMNIVANLLGLGNAATPLGLKAMQALTKYQTNKKIPCKEMMLLVIMNTTGFSLIPSTMMTLRQSYGSQNVLGFFIYSLAIGFIITIIGIVVSKVIEHYG